MMAIMSAEIDKYFAISKLDHYQLLNRGLVMKALSVLLFLTLANIASCKKGSESAVESNEAASKTQDLSLERYLTFKSTFPPSDWVKFTKDSPQLAGIFNLVGNNNGPYKYSFEINVPNEKLPAYGTKLILHNNDMTISIDPTSVIFGKEVSKVVEYCKTHSPIIKPSDCITYNYSRFLYEQNTHSFEMPNLADPEDAWIGLQLTFEEDVADTQKIRLMVGDAGEDGMDMIVKEGQAIGYGCRTSTPWPGCPKINKKQK
ncbi:hypothetical protein EBR21_07470 [bacterium]|nr:hypothetical protein [bacterium]